MRVLIVDDEQPARDRLRTILEDEDGFIVAGEARNGQEALVECERLSPDVILLDIRMPGLDGIETAQHLNTLETRPAVVFTTAYDEYAIDAFEARAIGYVLKPVRRAKLLAALNHASSLTSQALTDVAADANLDESRKHICARAHGELRLIPIESVSSFQADQKYVAVHHDNGCDLIDESLKSLEAEFAGRFVRIHRSALVAVERIERLEKTTDGKTRVVMRDAPQEQNELLVSRRHLAEVRRRLKHA